MRKLFVPLAAAFFFLLTAPSWAILDLSLSAEYVTQGKAELTTNIPLFPNPVGEFDLEGGILVKGMVSFLGVTVGAEAYSDSPENAGTTKIQELAAKAGFGIGLPGLDITALVTAEQWKLTDFVIPGQDLEIDDILLGVDALITLLPVLDIEAWYHQSVSSDVASQYLDTVGSGFDGNGTSYGLRVLYELAAGLNLSAGYRFEEHAVDILGYDLKLANKGYTLGLAYIF